jgi:hypothetical protein
MSSYALFVSGNAIFGIGATGTPLVVTSRQCARCAFLNGKGKFATVLSAIDEWQWPCTP